MRDFKSIDKIKIIFFSGTGSTAYVADVFFKALMALGKAVVMNELNVRKPVTDVQEDMLILIYPVHACNAPEAVYDFIKDINMVDQIPAVVISVSGGGEITPNTASRLHCIKRLKKKVLGLYMRK